MTSKDVIDRAPICLRSSEVRTDARQAVSALRGEQLPASAQLDALAEDRAQVVSYARQHGDPRVQ